MRRSTILLHVLLTAIAHIARAADDDCRDVTKIDACTIVEVYGAFTPTDVSMQEVEGMRIVVGLSKALANPANIDAGQQQTTVTAKDTGADLKAELRGQPNATTAPDGTGARIHASRENFNVPLSMAINSVDRAEDAQSLIIRFNTMKPPGFDLGITATITKPVLFESVEKAIEEAKRAATAKTLSAKLEDTDDIALTGLFTPSTPQCTSSLLAREECYGRDAGNYQDVVAEMLRGLLGDAAGTSALSDTIRAAFDRFRNGTTPPNKKFGALTNDEKKQLFDLIALTKIHDVLDTEHETAVRKKRGTANLATLVANQPQWVLKTTWRFRDTLVGPDIGGVDLEYERGIDNLNTVSSACGTDSDCLAKKLNSIRTASMTFGLHVKQFESYELSALPLVAAEGQTLPTFMAVTSDRVREYSARFQYGFDSRALINEKAVRIDFAAQWGQITGDPKRDKTRYGGSATLTIPLGEDVNLPVTVDYVNRAEFLKSQTKLGMHFGITYRLPFAKPKK